MVERSKGRKVGEPAGHSPGDDDDAIEDDGGDDVNVDEDDGGDDDNVDEDDHDHDDAHACHDGDGGPSSASLFSHFFFKIIITFVTFLIGIPNVAGRAVSTVRDPSS